MEYPSRARRRLESESCECCGAGHSCCSRILGPESRRHDPKDRRIAGRIIHADGIAAEGARVAIYAVREGAPAAIVGTAASSYDGRYEVTALPAGRFIVGVTPQRIRGFGGDSRRPSTPPTETMYPGTTDRMKAQPVPVFAGMPT